MVHPSLIQPLELVIVATEGDAIRAGFRHDGSHPLVPAMRAWWPTRDLYEFRGRQFARITVTERARVLANDKSAVNLQRFLVLIQNAAFVAPAMWMEL